MSKQPWLLATILILAACTHNISPNAAGLAADPAAPNSSTAQLTPTGTPPAAVSPAASYTEATSATAPPETTTPPAADPTFAITTITVTAGDTLLGLALSHSVPMAAIQIQNYLGSSTTIRVGQKLTIPPAEAWKNASPYWIVHIVSEGETLGKICQAYGVTLADLQDVNRLADTSPLTTGQLLVVPVTDLTTPHTIVTAPTATPQTAAPEVDMIAAEEPAATPAATSVPLAPIDAGPPAVADWPYETVRIMNEVRAQHGLPPLAYNETLARAAQIQADDCANRGNCSHTGSDGSTIKDRVLRVGYQPASWAECWAIRPTPQEAIDIWMDEIPPNDPHRSTLLTTWFTEIGVGVAEATWGYYFIADFGKPLQP